MLKIIFCIFSFLFLVYLIIPIPSSIEDFSALPNSVRSKLDGDTWQVPNNKAYFSDNYRDFVIPFYKTIFQQKNYFPFPPIRLNYPPEFAYTAIKVQTESTYLEEFAYPLRDSLFVNGFEQFYADGQPVFPRAVQFEADGQKFNTKVTLRYYHSPLWARLMTWMGINVAVIFLWRFGKKVFNE